MKSKVLFTDKLSSESLLNIYKKLNKELEGNVAVKIHSGEPGGNNFLKAPFMKELVNYVNGTIIEANTAYEGKRSNSNDHLKTMKEHGFTEIANVDIIDSDGDLQLPIINGKHLKHNYVGSHLEKYDSLLVLSHFKGHQMGGYGGALKNLSIGIASAYGKAYIHGAGIVENIWTANQDDFLESMAEAASSVMEYRKNNIILINVMCNISIDCDCNANPAKPEMKDIGILASLDPVALDQACIDLVYNSSDEGRYSLINRIEEKHGIHILEAAEKLNIGSRDYELIKID